MEIVSNKVNLNTSATPPGSQRKLERKDSTSAAAATSATTSLPHQQQRRWNSGMSNRSSHGRRSSLSSNSLSSLKAYYRKLRTFKGTIKALINLRRVPAVISNRSGSIASALTALPKQPEVEGALSVEATTPKVADTVVKLVDNEEALQIVQTQVKDLVDKGHVVTELGGDNVTYRMQGNLDHYTEENLRKRVKLQEHPHMVALTQRLWLAVGHVDEAHLSFGEYEAYMLRLHRLILPEFDVAQSKELIKDDWARDTDGSGHLDFRFFHFSMFELVDLWTDTVEAEDYISLLYCIMHCLTYEWNGRHLLKDLDDVNPVDIVEASKGISNEEIERDLAREVNSDTAQMYRDRISDDDDEELAVDEDGARDGQMDGDGVGAKNAADGLDDESSSGCANSQLGGTGNLAVAARGARGPSPATTGTGASAGAAMSSKGASKTDSSDVASSRGEKEQQHHKPLATRGSPSKSQSPSVRTGSAPSNPSKRGNDRKSLHGGTHPAGPRSTGTTDVSTGSTDSSHPLAPSSLTSSASSSGAHHGQAGASSSGEVGGQFGGSVSDGNVSLPSALHADHVPAGDSTSMGIHSNENDTHHVTETTLADGIADGLANGDLPGKQRDSRVHHRDSRVLSGHQPNDSRVLSGHQSPRTPGSRTSLSGSSSSSSNSHESMSSGFNIQGRQQNSGYGNRGSSSHTGPRMINSQGAGNPNSSGGESGDSPFSITSLGTGSEFINMVSRPTGFIRTPSAKGFGTGSRPTGMYGDRDGASGGSGPGILGYGLHTEQGAVAARFAHPNAYNTGPLSSTPSEISSTPSPGPYIGGLGSPRGRASLAVAYRSSQQLGMNLKENESRHSSLVENGAPPTVYGVRGAARSGSLSPRAQSARYQARSPQYASYMQSQHANVVTDGISSSPLNMTRLDLHTHTSPSKELQSPRTGGFPSARPSTSTASQPGGALSDFIQTKAYQESPAKLSARPVSRPSRVSQQRLSQSLVENLAITTLGSQATMATPTPTPQPHNNRQTMIQPVPLDPRSFAGSIVGSTSSALSIQAASSRSSARPFGLIRGNSKRTIEKSPRSIINLGLSGASAGQAVHLQPSSPRKPGAPTNLR